MYITGTKSSFYLGRLTPNSHIVYIITRYGQFYLSFSYVCCECIDCIRGLISDDRLKHTLFTKRSKLVNRSPC